MGRTGYESHGTVSVLASLDSSATTKPPALTDWVMVEEYPMISPDGIDPYQILENINNKCSDDSASREDSNENAGEKYLNALQRLNVTQYNLTLPIALMSLDSERYPSLSNARKACRQGKIAFRSAKPNANDSLPPFRKGLVGDRVYPMDYIVRRELYKNLVPENSTATSYETLGGGFVKSKFQNLHVAYEDNFMAVVVKPAGLLVHPQGKNGGWGRKNNVLNALPYFLSKPISNNVSSEDEENAVLSQPVPVHRLDFATSGLLLAAKTKGASRLLAQEFEYRKARKTYTAMVFGIPVAKSNDNDSSIIPSFFGQSDGDDDASIIDEEAMSPAGGFVKKNVSENGWDIEDLDNDDSDGFDDENWNFADCFLDNKRARTRWRLLGSHNCSVPIRYCNISDEMDNTVHSINVPISIVEIKPKTGRYHQLRRTMAWMYNTPMVGDPVYGTKFIEENFLPDNAELKEQKQARDYRASLMLCSNEIDVAHPYFNTVPGRLEWEGIMNKTASKTTNDLSSSSMYESDDGVIRVTASIQLPKKFTKFIGMMERKK